MTIPLEVPVLELIGIVVCFIFSGFFSGSETALTSLSDVRLEQIMERNTRTGKSLKVWRKDPNGVLTTILIGNNLSNITASVLASDLASTYFSPGSSIPIAIGVMTFLLLFFGEITPKTIARSHAETLAPLLMAMVMIFHYLFFPLTWVLTKFVRMMIILTGGRHGRRRLTEEDIEFVVSLGHRQGVLDKDKENLLSSVFEFTDTTVREIMVPRTELVALPLEAPFENALELAQQSGFSRIPVFEGSLDKIVGIFYTKSLITPPSKEQRDTFLASVMRPPVFVPESKKISELLKMFQKEHMHLAIVVDEFGGTEGIVTLEDIIEELLGEIHDEYDVATDRLVKIEEGEYKADARVEISELEDELDISFPDDRDYETLGGFLMEISGEVPSKDWEHEFNGFSFQVTNSDPQRVLDVRISRVEAPPEEGQPPAPESQPDAEAS
ncbi:MAG: hemolysin family protein [Deltaproteobacteria bacterium]|nr:hemolysin family protein [Deltaproteobacteria bacterium]